MNKIDIFSINHFFSLTNCPPPLPQTIIHPPDFENKNVRCPAWWNLSVPTYWIKWFATCRWLVQLDKCQSAKWQVEGSNLGWTNTQGLKITEENVLPLLWCLQWLDILVFLDKGKKKWWALSVLSLFWFLWDVKELEVIFRQWWILSPTQTDIWYLYFVKMYSVHMFIVSGDKLRQTA